MSDSPSVSSRFFSRRRSAIFALTTSVFLLASRASATDQIYFPAVDNVTNILVQKINAETVRIDMSCWYLTEHAISIALINRFNAGVPVRLIGDRGSIFEIDPLTKNEFYWLASQGLPIRLRYNPTWYPEIDHWKATIFAGQNLVTFGSANYTPFELAPVSSTDYKDESILFTTDASIVNAVKTKFDRFWNDTTSEPESLVSAPPYFKNWVDACATESACSDYATRYPNPAPMVINTARLEPDNPLPADIVWGQGPSFNNRLVQEIGNENTRVDFVIYRLTVDNITNALLSKFRAGVPMRIIMEPNEYLNRKWPEFWLTHANIDLLWAAGVPIKQRIHNGLTHMKTLVTSSYATNASSNYAAAWQRDIDYFIPATTKPTIYQALKDRFQTMWTNTAGFADFTPQPPDAPILVSPGSGATSVSTTTSLVWNVAPFAVSYDVYLGTSTSSMTLAGNVPAQMVNNPPATYVWTPSVPLQSGTTYFWKVRSRTNASMIADSPTWSFVTAGSAGVPAAPANPSPSSGATGVSLSPTLSWSAGASGTTYTIAFGQANPPPQVATGLGAPSYVPGTLSASTTYYWKVTAVSSGGSTAGPIWSFVTGTGGGGGSASDVVIYATDVAASNIHGQWFKIADSTAAAGIKLSNPDAGVAALTDPLANPTDYFDTSFQAVGGTRYRVWVRIHAINDQKWNDSFFVQFSDSVDSTNAPVYRLGTTSALMVNLWSCSTCQSFGWGWQRNAYWLADTGDVWFQNSGSHTLRIQVREDGAEIDQIVLSPTTYATNPPGLISNDATIVPKPSQGQAPAAPGSPNPANGATGVGLSPTLTWSAAGATSYDVRFGTANPPPLVLSGTATASYSPPSLSNGLTYFWQIVARNSSGATTGTIWSFSTATAPPGTPSSPNPADGATGIGSTVTLTWTASGATSYDVLLGPSDPPSQVASGIATASYTATGLTAGAHYVWQIVAHNAGGANQGPQWSFTTATNLPPSAPTSPNPTNGATGVATSPTLTWSAPGATSYDVMFGSTNPPPQVSTGQATASYTPAALTASTTYYWRIVARNAAGATTGSVWSFTTAGSSGAGNIVIYASDLPASALHGSWTVATDTTSPASKKLVTSDVKFQSPDSPLAAPADYVDVTFTANAGTPYTLWLRLQALNNSKFNDSVWVQFSDARVNGAPIYPLNSTSGLAVNLATSSAGTSLNRWGWQNKAYWLSQETTVTFATSGTHTLRIQVREDGVQLDQIVLSPTTYLTTAPGSVTNDSTIVPRP